MTSLKSVGQNGLLTIKNINISLKNKSILFEIDCNIKKLVKVIFKN